MDEFTSLWTAPGFANAMRETRVKYEAAAHRTGIPHLPVQLQLFSNGGLITHNRSASPLLMTVLNLSLAARSSSSGQVRAHCLACYYVFVFAQPHSGSVLYCVVEQRGLTYFTNPDTALGAHVKLSVAQRRRMSAHVLQTTLRAILECVEEDVNGNEGNAGCVNCIGLRDQSTAFTCLCSRQASQLTCRAKGESSWCLVYSPT